MTLKEIYKIIDEADYVHTKSDNGGEWFDAFFAKDSNKKNLELFVKYGYVFTYYKRNEETGEMTLLAKIDHIDKEKKVVKKKIDDMSAEELYNLTKNFCAKHPKKECTGCPLWSQEKHCIGLYFNKYKRGYLEAKDKEFEIEVEGK